MSKFIETNIENFNENTFKIIGKDWMLITAKADEKINTMTASWGGLGVMWGKNVAYVVIRPQRYTKELIDKSMEFSLSFLDDSFKKTLSYIGSTSGRDEDKIEKSNLTVLHEGEVPYFEEAKTVVFCRKLFTQDFKPESFIDTQLIEKWYPGEDFHTLYIAEVTKILVKN